MACAFCQIVSLENAASVVYRDPHVVAFLDAKPVFKGHTLVVPKTRRPTKPTRASKERRLEGKTRKQQTKRQRSRVRWDD